MADYWVSPSGDDGNPGTYALPKATWRAMMIAAADNDNIIGKPGTYDQEIAWQFGAALRNIYSETTDYRDVTIKPKTLSASAVYDALPFWYTQASQGRITAFDITFELNREYITNWNDTYFGCLFMGRGGTYAGIHHYNTRCNHILVATAGKGRCWYGYSTNRDGFAAYKSTFNGWKVGSNDWEAIHQSNHATGSNIDLRDCIFSNNRVAILKQRGSFTEQYNCFYNNDTDISGGTINATSFVDDPEFSTGVELGAGSPCIDAGVVVTGYVDTYQGLAPDMGCFEFTPSAGRPAIGNPRIPVSGYGNERIQL